ncbi:lipopolysaccharide assembly protein LapB [Mycobacterium sp. DL440]|uniref:tetratricopeptide repeat protein n=1 Tax=Mycobacterium sp. DL440 TaxID=2675523 RepID=UPI00141DAE29|nr:hypothetical protein [Mycobacterium sp. DL440]
MRKYLSTGEALEAFGSGEVERFRGVGRKLADLYKTCPQTDDAEGWTVELLLRSYRSALDPNANVEMYSGVTAERISSTLEERDATRYAGEPTFEQNLERIPPQRAAEARELRGAWPGVVHFVQEFVHSPDRASALVDWHNNAPTWFQTRTSEAVAWFARIANDYGLREIASAGFEAAIEAGATPVAYWRTRQILIASERIEELAGMLEPYADADQVARAIVTANTAGYAAAAATLRQWEPASLADNALKLALLSQLVAQDDLREAITLSANGFTHYRSGACGSLNAQFLLNAGAHRRTAMDFSDLERALEAALKARDAIRVWDGPSAGPVEIAIIAARLLGRVRQAWSLARPGLDGTATSGEAASEGVRREAATMAAQVKDPELARELAVGTGPMTEHEVEALIALFNGDDDVARAQFESAIEYAIEPQDVERLSLHLAQLGVLSPKLGQLTQGRHEEIGLIADAHNGSEQAVSILRTRARSNRLLARVLIGLSFERNDGLGAAKQAERSGEDWSDPDFHLLAAEQYVELEEYDSALRCADEALRFAGPAWENTFRAYSAKIQALTVRGRWAPAAKTAMDVLAEDPGSISAIWVLTLCQYHLGQFAQAWKTYTDIGHRPAPRDAHEACVRIDLWSRFEREASDVETLTALLERFPESREVKAAAVKALVFLPLTEEDDAATIEHVQSVIAPLLAELSDVFVQKEIDQDNPLASLNELVGDLPDTSEQDAQIERGYYPIGMAATLHRRSLTEILASRTRAPIFSGDPEFFEAEVGAALSAMGSRIVVDLTALYALSVLDDSLSDLLLGCFIQTEGARAQLIDSIQGTDSLAQRSTLQIGRAPDGAAFPITISEEEAETRHHRALSIRAQFDNVATNDRIDIEHFPEIPLAALGQSAWLAAVDNAIDCACPMWCDDRATRRLAADKGVMAFGTQALLEALRRNGTIDDESATVHQAQLIARYFVGMGFRDDWLAAAANLDGWKPRGSASFVAYSGPLPDATPLLNFVMQGIRHNLNHPDALRNWIAAASYWLVHVAPSEDAAQANLEILLSMLFREPWLESGQLPFVLRGVRDGIGTTNVGDPLKPVMEKHYRLLAERTGWAPAAQRIRELVALADPADRVIATGVVLQVR